jgi:hypothetical protein
VNENCCIGLVVLRASGRGEVDGDGRGEADGGRRRGRGARGQGAAQGPVHAGGAQRRSGGGEEARAQDGRRRQEAAALLRRMQQLLPSAPASGGAVAGQGRLLRASAARVRHPLRIGQSRGCFFT